MENGLPIDWRREHTSVCIYSSSGWELQLCTGKSPNLRWVQMPASVNALALHNYAITHSDNNIDWPCLYWIGTADCSVSDNSAALLLSVSLKSFLTSIISPLFLWLQSQHSHGVTHVSSPQWPNIVLPPRTSIHLWLHTKQSKHWNVMLPEALLDKILLFCSTRVH